MPTNPLSGKRVLVVDDVRAMRLLIRSLLVNCGINQVTEAGDGEEALEILRLNPIDLVVADILMSPMGGLEMTRRLRRRQSSLNPAVPILMISGKMDAAAVKDGIDAGVTDFLAKPLAPAAFKQRMETILQKPRETVKSERYFGPDRRRRKLGVAAERRLRAAQASNIVEI